jgi:TonB-dependent receptor
LAVQILNRIETYFYILNINQLKSIKMKSKYFNIRIFLILLLTGMFGSFHLAYSQSQNKGLIRGTVKDLDSQNPLPGANIRIVGTYTGTTTNFDGEYSLAVNAGNLEIEVSYIGEKTKTINVEINAGETKVVNFELEMEATQLNEIILAGSLDGQIKALNQQKSADNLKNVVSSDQMGKFPDQNSAESLQRVTGVNLQRDEGDGRFILVRGLAPQFTNISINGEQIPSPEGDSRFVALDAIPSNQLASIEITKSITPDMDGDAVGGSVNLKTPTAYKKQLEVSGSLGGEYNNSSEKTTAQGNVTLSKRTNNDKFGFIVGGSYAPSEKFSERYTFDGWDKDNPEGLDELEITSYEVSRKRIGANATLDYKFSDKSQIYFRTLYSELREVEQRRRLKLESEEDDDVLEYGISKEFKYRPENQGVYSFNLGGNYSGAKVILDYEIAHSEAFQKTEANEKSVFENAEDVTWSLNISDRFSPKLNSFTYDGQNAQVGNAALLGLDEWENEVTTAKDHNTTAKINAAFPLHISENQGELKMGGKLRFKDKRFIVDKFESYGYEGDDDLFLSDFADNHVYSSFMDGEFNQEVGPFTDRNEFNTYFNNNIGDFESDFIKAAEEKALQEYKATENVFAGYVQGKIQLNRLMLLAGVRYEKTNFDYASGQWDEDTEEAIAVSGTNDSGFLLPMFHLKYNISDNDILRASITKSYSRPNFQDLVQGATFNGEEASIFNPDLKPVRATNLDIYGEHYFGTLGLLSGGVFYKKLNDFIYQQTTDQTFRGIPDVEVTQSVNGDDASLLGFEIGYQQNLSFLPGVLKGLVVYLNYTHTASEANVANFAQGADLSEIDLPGQADNIGNAALAYNIGGFKARLSFNYNGSYINEFDGGDIINVESRHQWDFSMSQTFSKNKLTAFLELVNLTDEDEREFYNTKNTPSFRTRYGSWGRLGIRFNF